MKEGESNMLRRLFLGFFCAVAISSLMPALGEDKVLLSVQDVNGGENRQRLGGGSA